MLRQQLAFVVPVGGANNELNSHFECGYCKEYDNSLSAAPTICL